MDYEIIILVLVIISSLGAIFKNIKKIKSCCLTIETKENNDNQPQQEAGNLSLLQILINKFTPRKQSPITQSEPIPV